MTNVRQDDATPVQGTGIRGERDPNRTTQVICLRSSAAELAADGSQGAATASIDKILLEIEQNRFEFISSRDTDAAVHNVFNRLEELAARMSSVLAELSESATRKPS
jgi:hypothetical protein